MGNGNGAQPDQGPLHSSNAAAIGSALWDSGDLAGAGTQYERALGQNAADVEALHGLGRLRLARNDLAGALLLLEQALAHTLQLPHSQRDELAQRVRRDLAWALYRLDRFDLAAEYVADLPDGAALAAQLAAFEGRAPYRMSPNIDEIALPFLGTDPLPIVTVVIGGQEYAFVLDSGSSQLVVDSSLLRLLDLPSYGTRQATFASGQRAPLGYTIVPQVTLGEAALWDVPAEVMDVRRVAPQLFGFIGTNFLQRFHVFCDWEGQVLRLRPTSREPFAAWQAMQGVPTWFFDSHLLLAPARIGPHPTFAYLATGLGGAAFALPESTARQAQLEPLDQMMQGFGAGGAAALAQVRADELCVGDWCRRDMVGLQGFFPQELEWRYGFRVGLMLGQEFLRRRRLGLDFTTMTLYLE